MQATSEILCRTLQEVASACDASFSVEQGARSDRKSRVSSRAAWSQKGWRLAPETTVLKGWGQTQRSRP